MVTIANTGTPGILDAMDKDNDDNDPLDSVSGLVGRPLFFDLDGAPISAREYSRLREDLSYRVLARELVGDFEVITAWLGTDQGDGTGSAAEAAPLIFGSMPRRISTDALMDHLEVFASTPAQALANHAALVDQLRIG